MRTATKIWLIVAASLVLLGILILGGVMAIFQWDFSKFGTNRLQTNTHEISDSFRNISVQTTTGDVAFLRSSDGTCRVACYESERMKYSVSVENDTLRVQLIDTRKWYHYIGIFHNDHSILTVYLPDEEYDSLSLRGSTGDMGVPKDFRFDSVDIAQSTGDVVCSASVENTLRIKTTTGDIRVEQAKVGALDLTVSTGEVTVSSVVCEGDVRIQVSTGETELSDVACKGLFSNGSTGEIALERVIASEKLSIERSTGEVELEGCDAAEIFIKTDTGNVKGSLLTDKIFFTQTDTGSVNVPRTMSGGKCEIITDTGNIKINIVNSNS